MKAGRAIVFANGRMDGWPPGLEVLPEKDLIICADGGLAQALRWELRPDLIIGDLDSADPADLDRLAAQGIEIIRHPVEKDETDLELALLAALEREPEEIIILGGFGKRLDMTLANIFILASAKFQGGPTLRLMDQHRTVLFLQGPGSLTLEGDPQETVSLLPLGGPVRGVTLQGLKYPLKDAVLELGSTRGISNVISESPARIEIQEGGLIVVVSPEKD
jgi:thiamine pyrophosphokinase